MAESVGQTIVIETHVLTILNSPELIVEVISQIGSDRVRIVMDFVNHFQALSQIYASTSRLNYIFDTMGALCPVAHCKDICVENGFVMHFDEAVPGDGELDLACAMRRWQLLRVFLCVEKRGCFARTWDDVFEKNGKLKFLRGLNHFLFY